MERGGWGRKALGLLGVVMVAAGMLYGGSAMLRRDDPPAVADWTGWDGTVLFLGDSITEYCDLERFYPGLRTVNKGIAGDTTGGMLERLEQDVCALAPDIAVVHGGINDLALGVSEQTVTDNIRAIVSGIGQALPQTRIIVQSVYPIEEYASLAVTEKIQTVNAKLEEMAGQLGYRYADVYQALAGSDGRLTPGYADDGLHPNDKGYEAAQPVISQAIREAIAAWESGR